MAAKNKITCGAKTRAGTACARFPVVGRNRCKLHGGASLRGKNHWNYKHGQKTIAAKAERSAKLAEMRRLEEMMHVLGMTTANKTPGRKPSTKNVS